ncbi:MAG: M56 family metallopeptidase [Saprospiraceae bacterium]
MKKILENINIQDFQEYIALSIIQSLWIGSLLVIVLLLLELFRPSLSISNLHKYYKYSLFTILLCSLFVNSSFLISDSLDVLTFFDIQFSSKLIHWLSIFWLIGGICYLTKLTIAQHYINKIVRQGKDKFPEDWILLLNKSKQKIAYLKDVSFLFSDRIHSAFVTGIIKPIFVIPLSWINNLTHEEAEFILIHEIAHLKAKDQYINIVCNFTEIILFYNPAVHFIIKRIRFQRELCADQMVIKHISKPLAYASLLVKIGENPQLKPIVAFSSIKNQLGLRVKSILQLETHSNKNLQGFLYPIFIGILTLILMNNMPNQVQTELAQTNPINLAQAKVKKEIASVINKRENRTEKKSSRNPIIKKQRDAFKDKKHPQLKINELDLAENSEPLIVIKDEFNASGDPMQFMKEVDFTMSKSLVNKIKPSEYGGSSSRLTSIFKDRNYIFDKDGKHRVYPQQKLYKYFLIKDPRNTFLSYSFSLQSINQFSTIN